MADPFTDDFAERFLYGSFPTLEQSRIMVEAFMRTMRKFNIAANDTARCEKLARTILEATDAKLGEDLVNHLAVLCMENYISQH